WERDGLDEPCRRERVRDAAPRALLARVSAARRRQRQDRRHLVEAVDARDLLDEAPLVDEVGAPRRRRDVEAAVGGGDLAADALEDLALPLRRVLDANEVGGELDRQRDALGLVRERQLGAAIGRRTARELDQQVDDALRRGVRDKRIHAALEALGGLARQLVAPRRARDRDRVERGGLDDDVGRLVVQLGVGAAHDARETDGARVVGDEEILVAQRTLDAIERRELLALLGATHRDAAREARCVIP